MNSSFSRQPSLIHDDSVFTEKVKDAMKIVEIILDNTLNPSLASPNHVHTYDDKFTLSEFTTNVALTALLNVLDKMGLGGAPTTESSPETTREIVTQKLARLVQDEKKSVTMRFIIKETCTFLKEEEIEKEDHSRFIGEKIETTTADHKEDVTKTTQFVSRVVRKVKQFHWKVEIDYSIYMYCGDETDVNAVNSTSIITKKALCDVVTMTAKPPSSPTKVDIQPLDVGVSWLFQHVNKQSLQTDFKVNREKESCRTPRNNDDVREAWDFFSKIDEWFCHLGRYFIDKDNQISNAKNKSSLHKQYLSSISDNGIFVPVLPIFESISNEDKDALTTTDASTSPILPSKDIDLFFAKQYLTMTENIESLKSQFSSEPFMSSVEAIIVLLTKHAASITKLWSQSVDHIENMLCTQLYNAIGKHVSSSDLDEFVRSYNQKLFSDLYAPEPFCYAIRRPNHYPDGFVSIEEVGDGKEGDKHAMTFTRQLETSNGEYPMNIPINAATSVQFNGDLFLHAWMLQRFQQKPSFQLVSRARQFSSFLLLIGKLSGSDTFKPEHGIILQNKDEMIIPLIMDEMPSAREFKDAIGSLSPEQQRFAKAFRNMKLSSSVFGICVVQLKPQLEVLLGLPEKSLTKEIRLTQDLLSLFIDYQIPSDLLSYDGTDELEPFAKVEVVKGHVKKVYAMIDDLNQGDLKEARMKADMAFEESDAFIYRGIPPPPATGVLFGSIPPPSATGVFGSTSAPAETARRLRVGSGAKVLRSFKASSAPAPLGVSQKAAKRQSTVQPQCSPTSIQNVIQQNKDTSSCNRLTSLDDGKCTDLTKIPNILNSKFELFGSDEKYGGALRSTIINTSESWTKNFRHNLLSKLQKSALTSDMKKAERNKAFDLLDALSRSGGLPMSHSELHIVIASSHCFDKSVVNTVVQDNINPVEKIERSNLLVASIIHDVDMKQLVAEAGELKRIAKHSPLLIKDRMSEEESLNKKTRFN